MKEACAINKSLSTLGDVFKAIGEGAKHVPYRNSKLTHLLAPCLGGDGKTLMLVNVAPEPESAEESMHSLQFAAKVNAVELGGEDAGQAQRRHDRARRRRPDVGAAARRPEQEQEAVGDASAPGARAAREHGGGCGRRQDGAPGGAETRRPSRRWTATGSACGADFLQTGLKFTTKKKRSRRRGFDGRGKTRV